MTTQLSEVQAKTLINSIAHSKFSVTKGLSCRSSMNTSLGCIQSCSYCYIRFLGRWHHLGINEIFQHIEVRVNAPALLRKELARREKEWLWIGSTADCYQAFEEKYQLMRGCLEALNDHSYPYEIITKSPLVARDVDLLKASRDVGLVSMSLFSSLDDTKRQRIELKASSVQERLAALETLNRAGVRTMALLLPVLPGYSDDPGEIRALMRAVRNAGTTRVYAGVMRLYGTTWTGMKKMMAPAIHDLRDQLHQTYFGEGHSISASAHVPSRAYRRRLMEMIATIASEEGIEQFQCEDTFFDCWFGAQDEHADAYRYMTHYDVYRERLRLGRPLHLDEALTLARRYRHTSSYLASVEKQLDLLNRLTDPRHVAEIGADDE